MFDADRPILKSEDDKLNRSLFAKNLARCIIEHHDPHSFVVGLYGGWGVGKTSIINLVIEELNFASNNMFDDEKPIILNFSAWSYSGQDQLIYSFFRRLSYTLRSVPHFENRDQIVHLLELYVSYFTKKPIPKPLRTKRTWLHQIMLSKRDQVFAWESGRDLTHIKAELNELLKTQKHKFIIIIDNISRLFDYEIKQIFQIVKSMGDYANTAYLLALDKNQVIHALNKIGIAEGHAYLEKIVQLPFYIPNILSQDLENIFADRLNNIVASVPEDAWNSEYWADIYYSSLRYFFKTCRDITHFVNALNFSYTRVKDLVNPVDFFSITAVSLFAPKIYLGIRDNKDLFTDLLQHVYILDASQIEKEKKRCEEILARDNSIPREIMRELLIRLFPRLRYIYQPKVVFFHSDSVARKLRRICSADLFDLYFQLSLQSGQIYQAEFEKIIETANDTLLFDQVLTRLNQDERIIKFLSRLDSHYLIHIPPTYISAIITALLDNGDLFPQGSSGPLSLDTPTRIHRIIHGLLQQIPQIDERFLLLQKVIATINKSIYSIVFELREQFRQHSENLDTFLPLEFRDLTKDQLTSLCKLTASRIQNWAETERLIDHPHLLPLIYAWKEWGDQEVCQQFIIKMTNTDKGLIAFLIACFKPAIEQALHQYERKTIWEQCLKQLNELIPHYALKAHAKALFEDAYFEKLREREQLALMIFLDLINAKTQKIIPNTSA